MSREAEKPDANCASEERRSREAGQEDILLLRGFRASSMRNGVETLHFAFPLLRLSVSQLDIVMMFLARTYYYASLLLQRCCGVEMVGMGGSVHGSREAEFIHCSASPLLCLWEVR